ncbi:hypothetical protein AVEN_22447-1 [Araneus ventricosus]|uniref:Uncharacterized protein n=1 Tax=Araneus ventricosus TaxID=182803 RepID=A0A4Y2HRQ8_ARAVE|nr:hypothetical protein AVEN_22447-1 [Araneus ventricosus]
MDKVRLLPSGVQGPVPTEAALSSFTMNRSPIVLDTASSVAQDNRRRVRGLGRGTPMNLFESSALFRDFLWASGLLDLV